MKKMFALKAPGKADPRVVDAVKHEVRKYVKRERRKLLPEGFTEWIFHCKAGANRDTAAACDLPDIGSIIDQVAQTGAAEAYIEIIAEPGHRSPSGGSSASGL